MTVYWLMFAAPLLGAMVCMTDLKLLERMLWWLTLAMFVVAVGLRSKVGWDWYNYEALLAELRGLSFWDALRTTDPAYGAVEWVVSQLRLDVSVVNLVCAAIFLSGLFAFARRQPDPWLALLVAVPYGVIVMGMSYTRQSAAVGLEFFALNALIDRRFWRFIGFVFAAALFHKSALALVPLLLLYGSGAPLLRLGLAIGLAAVVFLGANAIDNYLDFQTLYIDQALASEGTGPRLAINAVAAVGYLLINRYSQAEPSEKTLMLALAVASIACIPMAFLYSTATDRLVLFLLPMQVFFWGRLSSMFSKPLLAAPFRLAPVAGYAVIQFVWLNYATHAAAWIHYQNVLVS